MTDFLEHRRIVQAKKLQLLPVNWWGDETAPIAECEHNWVDTTVFSDTKRHFFCTLCPAKKEEARITLSDIVDWANATAPPFGKSPVSPVARTVAENMLAEQFVQRFLESHRPE